MKEIKVALIQHKYQGDRKINLEYINKKIKEACKSGAKLVVLPELHMSEYFCQSEDVKYFDLADYYEDDIKYFSNLAKECEIVLVTSLFEKAMEGVYFNTAIVFEKDGNIAGKYRKMHIPDDPGFYEKFYFTPGNLGFEPINTSIGKLGILICWDQWFPEAARMMALKGAQILIYPTAIGWFDEDSSEEKELQLNSWIDIQKSHAIANSVFVLSCNRVGFEKDPSGVLEGTRFWGNSFICDPRGKIQAKTNTDEEILLSRLDTSKIQDTRRIWPFFRDRRVDFYKDLNKVCDE
ncbi:MAG: N-carbamoylputrescine amidase [uncultured Campylobacterales bacterium]|uniref:N-carbamoylputrescine amidase n=1 Tax=uncultured Campylobacterales bacterium TaxID=352960 RepID=A0A6S6TJU1_9BACT|nr:MAG: N-carbamoylputrescine amidase [uncultured Campylobacterales bacterium]